MAWATEDGRHEGWDSMELPNGQRYAATTNAGLVVRDDAGTETVVPYSEVIGWRSRCECGWAGEFWTRVTNPEQVNPLLRRIYVAADEDADAPSDVEEAMHAEWKLHVEPDERVADVREAARHAAQAHIELDQAVAAARSAGASWADIGDAAGITRQSARERWR